MKIKIKIAVISLLLISAISFSGFSVDQYPSLSPEYPDLSPEYLQTFDTESKYIIELGEGSTFVRVYDGQTGKFICTEDTKGLTDKQEITRMVLKDMNLK